MAVANFSNIQLAEFQASLEQIWADPQKSKNYTPIVDATKAILEQQTAVLEPLEVSNKEYDFKMKWVDHAIPTPAALTQNDDCTNTAGTEGSGKTQTYALDYKKSVTVSVERDQDEKSFISQAEMTATAQAAGIKSLLEDFNNTIPGILDTNRGTPAAGYVTGATGWTNDAVNKKITIASANFLASTAIPQWLRVKRLSRFQNAMLLDGGNLFNEYYTGLKTMVNADGKTVSEMYKDLPYRHDLDSFATASMSDITFLVDPGTVAIANRAKYPSIANAKWTNGASGSYLRYSMPLNIPGLPQMMFVNQGQLKKQSLVLDVQYSIVCSGGKELNTYKMILRAGAFVNPVRLLTTNTGIWKFQKV